jgi:hypothetical protein
MKRFGLTVAMGLIALALVAAAEAPASAKPKPGSAVNLHVSKALRKTLGDKFFAAMHANYPKEKRSHVIGPKPLYYGEIVGVTRAKTVYYAVGGTGFSDDPVSQQDGPHIWRKKGKGGWKYQGDTGGAICDAGVPRKLVKVWHLPC